MKKVAFGALGLPLILACASGATSGSGTQRAATDRYVISRAELVVRPELNAHEAVVRYRPQWLQSGTGSGFGPRTTTEVTEAATRGGSPDTTRRAMGTGIAASIMPQLYMDGRPYGELQALRSLSTEHIEVICFLPLPVAQSRHGLAVRSPIIEVVTRSSAALGRSC